eukprot:gb/GFBE01001602.1/.p1 GENE.gb/GFBE01001602.1/~~gb/GFBE01001602.1/.p1  ORF type:complete len:182 (+),score=31.93 gb/GFBE01001602.1/:1-546(+)
MAWDMGFNIQWAQRIEKEERSFLTGALEKERKLKEEARQERRKHRRSRASSRCSEVSGPLSVAGSSSIAGSSYCSSASQLTQSVASMRKSSSESAMIPDHLKAAAHFPVVDKDLMTARVKPTDDGTVPTLVLKPEQVKAMWWPGRGSYTKYHTEFKFADPPAWSPADILKDPASRRRPGGH